MKHSQSSHVGVCDVIYPDTTSRRARDIVGQRKNIKVMIQVHYYESVSAARSTCPVDAWIVAGLGLHVRAF